MKKRRVRVKIDKALLEALKDLGFLDGQDLDDVVNDAVREAVELAAHRRKMLAWVEGLNEELGHPSDADYAEAEALLDELGAGPAPERRGRR